MKREQLVKKVFLMKQNCLLSNENRCILEKCNNKKIDFAQDRTGDVLRVKQMP